MQEGKAGRENQELQESSPYESGLKTGNREK